MDPSSKVFDEKEVDLDPGFEFGEYDLPLSKGEELARKGFDIFLRFVIAICFTVALFDFMFSPVWLHGYVWTLNQNYTRTDLAEKSGGYMLVLQRSLLPRYATTCFVIGTIIGTLVLLKSLRVRTLSVWKIFKISSVVGILTGCSRCLQEKHRIFPTLHEGFYGYLAVFSVCLIILGLIRK